MSKSDYSAHIMIVAWINIVFSVLFAFVGVFAFVFLTGIGVVSQDPEAVTVLGFIGTAAAIFLITLAIPGVFAGYGLLKRRTWGRVVAIIVAILDLMNFPVGTGIGIYSLWVLSREEATAYFANGVPASVPAVSSDDDSRS